MSFKKAVMDEYMKDWSQNIRYVAFMVDTGITQKGARYMAQYMGWIAARRKQYAEKYPENMAGDFVRNQEHFTTFITSGEWK